MYLTKRTYVGQTSRENGTYVKRTLGLLRSAVQKFLRRGTHEEEMYDVVADICLSGDVKGIMKRMKIILIEDLCTEPGLFKLLWSMDEEREIDLQDFMFSLYSLEPKRCRLVPELCAKNLAFLENSILQDPLPTEQELLVAIEDSLQMEGVSGKYDALLRTTRAADALVILCHQNTSSVESFAWGGGSMPTTRVYTKMWDLLEQYDHPQHHPIFMLRSASPSPLRNDRLPWSESDRLFLYCACFYAVMKPWEWVEGWCWNLPRLRFNNINEQKEKLEQDPSQALPIPEFCFDTHTGDIKMFKDMADTSYFISNPADLSKHIPMKSVHEDCVKSYTDAENYWIKKGISKRVAARRARTKYRMSTLRKNLEEMFKQPGMDEEEEKEESAVQGNDRKRSVSERGGSTSDKSAAETISVSSSPKKKKRRGTGTTPPGVMIKDLGKQPFENVDAPSWWSEWHSRVMLGLEEPKELITLAQKPTGRLKKITWLLPEHKCLVKGPFLLSSESDTRREMEDIRFHRIMYRVLGEKFVPKRYRLVRPHPNDKSTDVIYWVFPFPSGMTDLSTWDIYTPDKESASKNGPRKFRTIKNRVSLGVARASDVNEELNPDVWRILCLRAMLHRGDSGLFNVLISENTPFSVDADDQRKNGVPEELPSDVDEALKIICSKPPNVHIRNRIKKDDILSLPNLWREVWCKLRKEMNM